MSRALVLHQHDQAGGDVERRHDHDDRQDQEHHVALHLQRIEERGIALAPVDHEDRAAGCFGDEPAVTVDLVRLVDIYLDGGDVAGAVEIGLRLGQRHEHERGIVFRHADFENGGDLVRLDARRRAHRRHRAARSHQRDAVAHAQRQLIGQPPPDRHALPGVEAFERALPDVVGDGGQLGEIGGAHAAHQHARRIERRGRQRLPLHDRCRQYDPGTREMRSATASQSVSGCSSGWISRCPLRPKILSSSSLRKPFITAITMMSVATPSMMPRKENAALTEINPSWRRARRYRSDSIHSNGAKGRVLLVSRIGLFPAPGFHTILAVSGPARPPQAGTADQIKAPAA